MCGLCNQRHTERLTESHTQAKRCVCQFCKRPFGPYPGMVQVGFQSRSVWHKHEATAGTPEKPLKLDIPIHFELCLTCYRNDQLIHGEAPLFDPPYAELELDRAGELLPAPLSPPKKSSPPEEPRPAPAPYNPFHFEVFT